MTPALALLPSPLLGPAVWQPVADRLTGHGCTVVSRPAALSAPRHPAEVLTAFLTALPPDEEIVLVAHSNAGLYVPALAVQRSVRSYVFVDALLPSGNGAVPVASAAVLDLLRTKADAEGLLPPWTAWWDEADVAALFPSADVREQVERQQLRLPLAYFEASVPVPPGWDAGLGGYLAFGDTYERDRAEAARRGWPVVTLPGRHLHMLHDPDRVAREILALVAATERRHRDSAPRRLAAPKPKR